MKTLIITVIITIPFLHAEQAAYNILSQLKQQNEQKEHIKESPISYSQVAYYMAEGAVVTTVACLPIVMSSRFMTLFDSDNQIYDLNFRDKCALTFQGIYPGYLFSLTYALKSYNSRQPQAVNKKHDQETCTFTIEPVSYQDKLNAHAKFVGSMLAVLGIGVVVYRSLND